MRVIQCACSFIIVQRPRGTRLFHQIAIVVLTTGALSYFSMASDLGSTPIPVEFRGDGTRQIWVSNHIVQCTLPWLNDLLLVREIYPVVYHIPVIAIGVAPRYGAFALRHLHNPLYGHRPRHYWPRRGSRSEHVQVGLLHFRCCSTLLYLVRSASNTWLRYRPTDLRQSLGMCSSGTARIPPSPQEASCAAAI